MTPDQTYCVEMLTEWVRGSHHLPKVRPHGSGVECNVYADLSTYDSDKLTRLVLLAHRDSIRVEIVSSGPRMVKVVCHRRKAMRADMGVNERHPTLTHLRETIDKMIAQTQPPEATPPPTP